MDQMLLMIDGTRNFLPYLRQNKRYHRSPNDRRIREQKCKQKALIWLAWEMLRDLYHSPLTVFKIINKVALLKRNFISVFKTKSSGTCLLFASNHGFSTF